VCGVYMLVCLSDCVCVGECAWVSECLGGKYVCDCVA